jgi:hypothetical protein
MPLYKRDCLRYGEQVGSLSEMEKVELELVTDNVHGGLLFEARRQSQKELMERYKTEVMGAEEKVKVESSKRSTSGATYWGNHGTQCHFHAWISLRVQIGGYVLQPVRPLKSAYGSQIFITMSRQFCSIECLTKW